MERRQGLADPARRQGLADHASRGDQDLLLRAIDLPPNVFGIFYYGTQTFLLPFGNGVRCISGSTQRLAFRQADGSGVMIDPDVFAQPMGNLPLVPGTFHFQAWYRDQNPINTTNFTLVSGYRFQ